MKIDINTTPTKDGDDNGNSDSAEPLDIAQRSPLSSSAPLYTVPPSPSSASVNLDVHKVALRATQNQSAIKRLEEKNEALQKEMDVLRQDIELLKKLVVSLDLQQKANGQNEKEPEEKKTSTIKTSAESTTKTNNNTRVSKSSPSKGERRSMISMPAAQDFDEDDTQKGKKKNVAASNKEKRDEKTSKQGDKSPKTGPKKVNKPKS